MEEYPKPEQHWFDADKNSGSEPSKKIKPLSHTEIIKCPECSKIQSANVKHTQPFYSYVHECIKCKYIIMESEWVTVKPKKKKPTGILKDLSELKRYWIYNRVLMENENGSVIKVSDVEAIINKYLKSLSKKSNSSL